MADHNAILRAIKARLLPPEAHTKDTAARAADGTPVHPCSKDAVCWCFLGAARVETSTGHLTTASRFELRQSLLERLSDAAAELWPDRAPILPALNDFGIKSRGISGYDAVHLVLDRAIENCPP